MTGITKSGLALAIDDWRVLINDDWRSLTIALYMVLVGYGVLVGIPVISTAWVTKLGFTEVEVGRVAGMDLICRSDSRSMDHKPYEPKTDCSYGYFFSCTCKRPVSQIYRL